MPIQQQSNDAFLGDWRCQCGTIMVRPDSIAAGYCAKCRSFEKARLNAEQEKQARRLANNNNQPFNLHNV